MRLDVEAARQAMATLADRLGLDVNATARGIYRMVCEAMAGAVRAHAADRGVDYRGIPMLAFGGAGPVHACTVAEILNSSAVIFPPLASVYSAFGSLVTPIRLDSVRSWLAQLARLDWDRVGAIFDDMEAEGRKALLEAGCDEADITYRYAADMRYVGQQFETTVELPSRPDQKDGARVMRERFDAEYLKRYRLTQDMVDAEVVTWRVTATVASQATPTLTPPPVDAAPTEFGDRLVHLWKDDETVPTVARSALRQSERWEGPLIIEEAETTIVIPPGWSVTVGALGAIISTNDRYAGESK
jgi:N-methylhydantoinase A